MKIRKVQMLKKTIGFTFLMEQALRAGGPITEIHYPLAGQSLTVHSPLIPSWVLNRITPVEKT